MIAIFRSSPEPFVPARRVRHPSDSCFELYLEGWCASCKPTGWYVLIFAVRGATGGRQPRRRAKRSLIIDAAARAFAEAGFEGVSLNDLIVASGMSKGAFYFHFSNKDEVALAAFRTKQRELIARLEETAEPAASVGEELCGALRRRARLISDDPTMYCVVRLGGDLKRQIRPRLGVCLVPGAGSSIHRRTHQSGYPLGRVSGATRSRGHRSGDLCLDRGDGLTVSPGLRWQGPRGAHRGGAHPLDAGARCPTSYPEGPARENSKQDREGRGTESEGAMSTEDLSDGR